MDEGPGAAAAVRGAAAGGGVGAGCVAGEASALLRGTARRVNNDQDILVVANETQQCSSTLTVDVDLGLDFFGLRHFRSRLATLYHYQ